jgi:predicted nucleic acid-binding Zn ribbon protein
MAEKLRAKIGSETGEPADREAGEQLAKAKQRIRMLWILFYAVAIIIPIVAYMILKQ